LDWPAVGYAGRGPMFFSSLPDCQDLRCSWQLTFGYAASL